MSSFTWAEIKLPLSYYIPGLSFAEAFSISPNGKNIVGTFGLRPPNPANPPPLLSGEFHGFLRPAGGLLGLETFAAYDYPDNAPPVTGQIRSLGATSARGINDAGDIVGFFRDETRSKEVHGYLWPHGEDRPVDKDFPTAIPSNDLNFPHNAALGINNHQGIVIGSFQQTDNPQKDCGYVMGGNLLVVDFDQFETGVTQTTVRGSNANLEIVGNYVQLGETHGYKAKVDRDDISLDGDPTTLDIALLPQDRTAGLDVRVGNTRINGINDQGWIVGQYETFEVRPDGKTGGNQHGFVWKPDSRGVYTKGKHVTIDIAGAKDTVVNGIANDGTFVGYYIDGSVNKTGRHAYLGRLLP